MYTKHQSKLICNGARHLWNYLYLQVIDNAFLVATSSVASLTNQILLPQHQSLPACQVQKLIIVAEQILSGLCDYVLLPLYKTLEDSEYIRVDMCATPLVGTSRPGLYKLYSQTYT